MRIVYTASERFSPENGEAWDRYVAGSGLKHLKEVVSLDAMLCPSALTEIIDADWNYSSGPVSYFGYTPSLDYLLTRFTKSPKNQVLAVVENPSGTEDFDDERFEFIGYDLIDETPISALTNCGGFENAFRPDDLSEYGLVSDYDGALRIKLLLERNYPDEPHASCSIWKIWRMRSNEADEPKVSQAAGLPSA